MKIGKRKFQFFNLQPTTYNLEQNYETNNKFDTNDSSGSIPNERTNGRK